MRSLFYVLYMCMYMHVCVRKTTHTCAYKYANVERRYLHMHVDTSIRTHGHFGMQSSVKNVKSSRNLFPLLLTTLSGLCADDFLPRVSIFVLGIRSSLDQFLQ